MLPVDWVDGNTIHASWANAVDAAITAMGGSIAGTWSPGDPITADWANSVDAAINGLAGRGFAIVPFSAGDPITSDWANAVGVALNLLSGSGEESGNIYRTNNESFTVHPGQPLKFDGDAGARLAQADALTHAAVGIAIAATESGGQIPILLAGLHSQPDWTTATGGSALLTPGAAYFLAVGAPGSLSLIAATSTGQIFQYLALAVSETELFLQVGQPIPA